MPKLSLPILSKKKLLLLGFLFVSILAIPATVYLVKQQQDQRTLAVPNTNLSFSPSAQTAEIGDLVPFSIWVDPGNNQVSFIKLVITYDESLVSTTENDFVINPLSNLTVIQGPVVNPGEFSVVLTVQADPTKVLQTNTEIGTITFIVENPSDDPTQIAFDPNQMQISSIAAPDSFTENVFLSGSPATITILDEVILTPTPIATISGTLTPTITQEPTISEEPITTETPTPTVIGGEVPTPITNVAPVCSSLFADLGTTGVAPYTLIFFADGFDDDGTISKVTFDFGDGAGETTSEGIEFGLSTFSIQKSHTYTSVGTFTATVVLTDDSNTVSSSSECSLEIVVTDIEGGGGEIIDTSTPTPTIAAPGPAEAIVGIGMIGGVLFLIGTLLFFAL